MWGGFKGKLEENQPCSFFWWVSLFGDKPSKHHQLRIRISFRVLLEAPNPNVPWAKLRFLADWVMVPEGGAASKGTSLLTIRECPKAGAQKPGPTGTGQSWVATFWSKKACHVFVFHFLSQHKPKSDSSPGYEGDRQKPLRSSNPSPSEDSPPQPERSSLGSKLTPKQIDLESGGSTP